jgi:hypothetical protein
MEHVGGVWSSGMDLVTAEGGGRRFASGHAGRSSLSTLLMASDDYNDTCADYKQRLSLNPNQRLSRLAGSVETESRDYTQDIA